MMSSKERASSVLGNILGKIPGKILCGSIKI
jgi:hypothetical protein